MLKTSIVRHIKVMLSVQNDTSDRASIVMEGFFLVCFAFVGFFILQSESLHLIANTYLIPTAFGTLAIAAALILSILFRFRRLHFAAVVARQEADGKSALP